MKFVPYGIAFVVVFLISILGVTLLNSSVIMSGNDLSETQLAEVSKDIAELNASLASLNEGLDKIAIDVADLDTKVMKATIALNKNINKSKVLILELGEMSEQTDILAEDEKIGCLFGMFSIQTPDPTATWTRPVLLCGSGLFYQMHGPPPGDVIGPLPPEWSFEPLNEEELRRAGFPPKIEVFN